MSSSTLGGEFTLPVLVCVDNHIPLINRTVSFHNKEHTRAGDPTSSYGYLYL